MSQEYVLVGAFRFRNMQTEILLVEKNRPEWQKGRYNLIGGKVETGETPSQAAVRELKEETGYQTNEGYMIRQGEILDRDFVIHVFLALSQPDFDTEPSTPRIRELNAQIGMLESEKEEAILDANFERAAVIRDQIRDLVELKRAVVPSVFDANVQPRPEETERTFWMNVWDAASHELVIPNLKIIIPLLYASTGQSSCWTIEDNGPSSVKERHKISITL